MKTLLAAILLFTTSIVGAETPCYAPTFRTDANLLVVTCVTIIELTGDRVPKYKWSRTPDVKLHFLWNPKTLTLDYKPEYPRETL